MFEAFIAVVMASCKSDFCQINVNFLDEKWDDLHTGAREPTSDNLYSITSHVIQQSVDTEIFDLDADSRFNEQKVFVNEQQVRHLFGAPLITKDGLEIGSICIMDTKPRRFSEHQKLMVNLLARDIILQVEILKRDHQLGEISRLKNALNKELNEFTHIASHDLASPLNGIKNLVSWIEEDTKEGNTDDNPKYFKMVKNSIERMNRLLKGLGDYSRVGRDTAEPEQLSLNVMIAECCDMLEATHNFEFQVDECEFELPKASLMLVFKHLISNIIKHHHKNNGLIRISCLVNSESYQFSITDDGPGIAPEYHNKVFMPFQTLKPKDEMETSGLGLAIVKKIVSIHGGNITLDSHIGSGSVFTITWPISHKNEKYKSFSAVKMSYKKV